MLTDLVQIRRQGEKLRTENQRLRVHLKRHDFVERRLRRIAQEVEEAIDCRACANCCREGTVRLTDRDIEHLAKFLGMSIREFRAQYTAPSEEEGLILKRAESGCVFLAGNDCTVYDARPRACVNFPHLVRGDGSLVSRMWDMPDRATYCPIVFNTLEAWKDETKFKRGE
jgi:uncharacterized protein